MLSFVITVVPVSGLSHRALGLVTKPWHILVGGELRAEAQRCACTGHRQTQIQILVMSYISSKHLTPLSFSVLMRAEEVMTIIYFI